MSKPGLLLIGAGGHAHACIDAIESHGQFSIAGLVGRREEMHTRHLGYEVIATDDDLPQLAGQYEYALITVGQIRSPDARMRLYRKVLELGFRLPFVVAQSAHVSRHSTVGAGSIVMHGAIINAGAQVGENCIINTRSLLEHDCMVGDHCHISTGAILNGDVRLGSGCFVGSGSVIKEGVVLGTSCVIGMGLAVRHSLADHSRFVGKKE